MAGESEIVGGVLVDPAAAALIERLAERFAEKLHTIRGPENIRRSTGQGRPNVRFKKLDLSTARMQEEFVVPGQQLVVVDAVDGSGAVDASAKAEIQLNYQQYGQDAGPLKLGVRYQLPFDRFFITNAAQAGKKLTLAITDDERFFAENLNLAAIASIGTISQLNNIVTGTLALVQRLAQIDGMTVAREGYTTKARQNEITGGPTTVVIAAMASGKLGWLNTASLTGSWDNNGQKAEIFIRNSSGGRTDSLLLARSTTANSQVNLSKLYKPPIPIPAGGDVVLEFPAGVGSAKLAASITYEEQN